ncbi:MAG TPA: hypothetical protein VFY71_03260 [Planctomycetota bacterium]|nr:hypothetical protein [Planctomycetota bacterium]
MHTHSARQTLWLADDGLILRHDYVAEVVGRWAHGAHFWLDYQDVRGVPIALRRRVHARVGERVLSAVVLDARFGSARFGPRFA